MDLGITTPPQAAVPLTQSENDAAEKTVDSLLKQLCIDGDDVPLNGTQTYTSGGDATLNTIGSSNIGSIAGESSNLLTLMSGDHTTPGNSRSPANQSASSAQQSPHAVPSAAASANGNATMPPRTITRKIDATGKNIFVNGLPLDVDDANLRKMFETFGEIVSTHVLCDLASSKSRGMGFVHFADTGSVANAVSTMNGHKFTNGSTLHVRIAYDDAEYTSEETNKLFVRHVSKNATTASLWQFFEQFGTVVQVNIQEDISAKAKIEGSRSNMAYVTFSSIEDANNALAKCVNERPFGADRPLALKRAESLKCRNQRLKRITGPGGGGNGSQGSPQNSNSSMTGSYGGQNIPSGGGLQQQQGSPILLAHPQGLSMSGSNGGQMRMSGGAMPIPAAPMTTPVGFTTPGGQHQMMAPGVAGGGQMQPTMMLAPGGGSPQTISPNGSAGGVALVPGPQIMYVVPTSTQGGASAGGSPSGSPNGSAHAMAGGGGGGHIAPQMMMMAPGGGAMLQPGQMGGGMMGGGGMQMHQHQHQQLQQQQHMHQQHQQQQQRRSSAGPSQQMGPTQMQPMQIGGGLQGFGGANMSHLQQFRK